MGSRTSKKRWLRRLVILAVVLLCLPGLLLLALQTPQAKRAMTALISTLVSEHTAYTLHIDGLTGTFPHNIRVASVDLTHADGRLATLHDLEVKLALSPLLRGRIHLHALTLAHLQVWGRPPPGERWRIPRIPQLPAWPTIDVLRLDRITVDEAVLGVPASLTVTGKVRPAAGWPFPEIELEARGLDAAGIHASLRYTFDGGRPHLSFALEDEELLPAILDVTSPVSMQVSGAGDRADWRAALTVATGNADVVEAGLHLTEGDDTSLDVTAEIHVVPLPFLRDYAALTGDSLAVRVVGAIDRQGLLRLAPISVESETLSLAIHGTAALEQEELDLALSLAYDDMGRLPGVPLQAEQTPVQLDASLRGAFSAPTLQITASVNDEETLDGTVNIGINDTLLAEGALRVTPPALARDRLPWLPDADAAISFDAAYDEDAGVLHLSTLDVVGAGITLSAQGTMTPETPAFDLTCALTVESLSRLDALLPAPLQGSVQANLVAQGDAEEMTATFTSEMETLDADMLQMEHGRIEITGRCTNWFSAAPTAINADITSDVKALHISGMAPMDLTLAATVAAPTLQEIRIASLSLTDGHTVMNGEVNVDLDDMTGDAYIDVVIPAISRLPLDMEGLPGGALRLQARSQGALSPLSLETTITGDLRGLDDAPAALMALVGQDTTFEAGAVLADDAVRITGLSVNGAAFQADGDGEYAWNDGTLTGALRVLAPDIGVPGEAMEQQVSGAVSMNIAMTGVMPQLDITARIEGDGLTYAMGPEIRARFTIDAHDVPVRPAITITGEAEGNGDTLALDMRALLENDIFSVAPVALTAGENRVTGQGTYNIATGIPEGQIEADLADIAALAALAGLEVSGDANVTARLLATSLDIAVAAQDLRYGETTLETFNIQFDAASLWDAPEGMLSLDIVNLASAPVTIDKLGVVGSGTLDALELTATMDGMLDAGAPEPQQLTCNAKTRVFIPEQRLEITQFAGFLGAFPYALDGAATVALSDSGARVTPLTVRVGDGAMHIEALYKPALLSGALRFEALPLALSGLFMEPVILGALDGAITLAGALENPTLSLSLQVTDALVDMEAAEEAAPLAASLDARLADGQLEAALDARMDDIATAVARGNTTVLWQLRPWMLTMPPAAPVSGQAEIDALFEALPQMFGLVEHHLDAQLTGAFQLTGTMDAPSVSGDAHIRDAQYENTVTGTRLEQINLHVRANGTTLVIEQCVANTGQHGSLSAAGEARLLVAENFPFEATVEFKDAELARLDYVNGRVNGALTAAGDLGGVLVSGDLVVGPVNASMPDQMPVSEPTVIEVVEVADDAVIVEREPRVTQHLPEVKLDIRCDIPRRVFVRTPILDSEWGGNLRVSGMVTDPNVEGRVSVLRGHLDFLGRRFQLRDSAITFPGGAPTTLLLDMRAVAETPALSAWLILTGDLDEVDLALRSEPPLPQDEILAQVLFGRDLSRITPMQAIQLARIAAMFNSSLGGMQLFSGNIGLPGIDRLDIRTGERIDETVVGMGKYFTDSVYVEVEQGTTSDSGKISVEVELTPQVSVKGDVDAAERSGVGLFWRRDY